MPIKENKSNNEHIPLSRVFSLEGSPPSAFSTVFDTADYDNGVTLNTIAVSGSSFNFTVTAISQNTILHPPSIYPVEDNQIIGQVSDLNKSTISPLFTPAATVGLIGVDRYVFISGTIEAFTGDACVTLYVLAGVEVSPGES